MSTAQQQHGGAAPDAHLPGQAGDGGAPANGDRDSVDDVIERLLSVRGEWEREKSTRRLVPSAGRALIEPGKLFLLPICVVLYSPLHSACCSSSLLLSACCYSCGVPAAVLLLFWFVFFFSFLGMDLCMRSYKNHFVTNIHAKRFLYLRA